MREPNKQTGITTHLSNDKLSSPSALRAPSGSSVAMEIAPLREHRMTSSHSSKDPLRPPVSGGQSKQKSASKRVQSNLFELPSVSRFKTAKQD